MRKIAVVAATAALTLGAAIVQSPIAAAHGNHSHGRVVTQPGTPLVPLADSCDDAPLAGLPPHNGFQSAQAQCVDTQFGAVSAFENNPTLLITEFPKEVKKGENIVFKVSTKNLLRDRFLAAGQGGYYIESATLDENGVTRGHFHSGCQLLDNDSVAPPPTRLDSQGANRFVATEDGKRGAASVTITIPGFNQGGIVQCSSWAGDGSHRIPMMSFANVRPAFDSFRVEVK